MLKKALVVDDDESILDAISLILEDAGYTVETLSNGEEIFSKMKQFNPDVILLDVLMSGTDGRDICKVLKKNPLTKQVPVVMISAHPSAKEGAIASGAENFLAKPFDMDELIKMVSLYAPTV